MRRNLTLVGKMGIIISAISAAILLYYLIVIFATANTLKPPSWLLTVAFFLIAIAGILLAIQTGRKAKQTPS
jgi:hypothetical protein